MIDLLDSHTHTLVSGHAYNTVNEMVAAAQQKGLALLALTEHAPNMPGTCYDGYFYNLKILPGKRRRRPGRGMRETRGTAGRIFSALAHAKINCRMIDRGSGELNIIIGVANEDFEKAPQAIYDIFILTQLP